MYKKRQPGGCLQTEREIKAGIEQDCAIPRLPSGRTPGRAALINAYSLLL